jgi:hypothetical protein
MKTYGGEDVKTNVILTSELAGGQWSASRPSRFTPGTHCREGWVGHRTGLDDVERKKISPLPGHELRPLGRPARGQMLYRLLLFQRVLPKFSTYFSPHACVLLHSRPSHPSRSDHLNNVQHTVQIKNLLILELSPASCRASHLHFSSNHPQPMFLA